MAVPTIQLPPPEVTRVADLFDEAVTRLLRARTRVHSSFGRYESSVEANNLLILAIRNLEAFTELARRDLVLLPAALVVARTIFELSARAIWLLFPGEPFDREARWLAFLRTEEKAYQKSARLIKELGGDARASLSRAEQLRQFRESVAAMLPPETESVESVPDLRSILRSVGDEPKYLYYAHLSEFTHGSHLATGLYRKHLGTMKQFGEEARYDEWHLAFVATWYSFSTAAQVFMNREAGGYPPFEDEHFPAAVAQAISRIATGKEA